MKARKHAPIADTQLSDDGLINFGTVFADGSAVCDFTGCMDEIAKLLPVVADLLGREITKPELRVCEHMIREQYLSRHPFSKGVDEDTHVYRTPWMYNSGPICIRIKLLRRQSLKILDANKKMAIFELCGESGNPIGTMRSLPWHIDNFHEIAYAVRAVHRGWFPRDLLGGRLANAWYAAGASEELPCVLPLGNAYDGDDFSIRFNAVDAAAETGGPVKVQASFLINDEETPLVALLPTLLQEAVPGCFDSDSFDAFCDMAGWSYVSHRDWRFMLMQRFDFFRHVQSRYGEGNGIVSVVLPGGGPGLIFDTGERMESGRSVYGLFRDRADGRWTHVDWVLAEHLHGIGMKNLPSPARWDLAKVPFDASLTVGPLARHVLDNASRWACPESLTGQKDHLGHDIFVDDDAREAMYAMACGKLKASLAYAASHLGEIAYGYYRPVVDRVKGEVSPVAAYLPAFFSAKAEASATPDAVFVLRLVNESKVPHYEVPTILPPEYVRRAVQVIGPECPEWLFREEAETHTEVA